MKKLALVMLASASLAYCSDNTDTNGKQPFSSKTSTVSNSKVSSFVTPNNVHLFANVLATGATLYNWKQNGCDSSTKFSGAATVASWMWWIKNRQAATPTKK